MNGEHEQFHMWLELGRGNMVRVSEIVAISRRTSADLGDPEVLAFVDVTEGWTRIPSYLDAETLSKKLMAFLNRPPE